MVFTGLAYALGGKGEGGVGGLTGIIPLLLMFVVFYFILIRPSSRGRPPPGSILRWRCASP